ncbi:MAG: ATP-binding protein [Chloroflexi bacterium]|nr:ATP-binding protein [Chloroflexota bacterium]
MNGLTENLRSLIARPGNGLRELVDFAEEALFILDERGNIQMANRAAQEMCPTTLIGVPLGEALPSPVLAALVEDLMQLDEKEMSEQVQIDECPFRVRVRALAGRRKRIAVSLQDISELVRLNRARRDMVANISHELRTPISSIRIIIESLFHEKERPRRRDSIASLRAIQREADSLQHLAEELLMLSMMETGQIYLRMQPVQLGELFGEVSDREEERRELAEVTVHNRVDREISVLADPDQLRRVLVNLLHNAMKWTPVGGEIVCRAEQQGEEVKVMLQDSGAGIPADQTQRIFERFYQMDDSRSRGEGIGLGLAICRHIIEAHGGRIWAEAGSTAGGGFFAFTLLAS